jgi:hypothetical protein
MRHRPSSRHVLHDQDAGAVGRHLQQEILDRLGAAGGGAHDDELLRRREMGTRRGRGGRGVLGPHLRALRRSRCRSRRRSARTQPCPGGGADLVGDLVGVFIHAVAHAELGLGDKIHRTELQRTQRGFRTALRERRDHHHRRRAQAHELFQEVEPVHLGHFDVQREHVRVGLLDEVARDDGVWRHAHHFHVGLRVDDLLQDAADQCRIVDTQHLNLAFVVHMESKDQE